MSLLEKVLFLFEGKRNVKGKKEGFGFIRECIL